MRIVCDSATAPGLWMYRLLWSAVSMNPAYRPIATLLVPVEFSSARGIASAGAVVAQRAVAYRGVE